LLATASTIATQLGEVGRLSIEGTRPLFDDMARAQFENVAASGLATFQTVLSSRMTGPWSSAIVGHTLHEQWYMRLLVTRGGPEWGNSLWIQS